MKKTIFDNPIRRSNENNAPVLSHSQSDDVLEGSSIATTDPEGLDWLEEGLPDLSSVSHHHFNLAKEFNISRYLTILADEVNNEIPVRRNIASMSLGLGSLLGKVDKLNDVSTVAPLASAWAV